ncbi:MAG: putative oxidoreductase [Candidatus Ordinivivax streblomastigis]|uniref:Putative oxidoreductase n=1 Tax=Candidatus Ordinivivax streblomastigis TaxID=2540710 RepID=A0A5M8NTD3_9BACT|nr:MAG: putative oxidoreductase [Candidatus Ordinivivax streblomastigis]
MNTFEGKVALVTGAGQGIGLATARAFAETGATVVLADINEPKEQAQELVNAGYKVVAALCDVANDEAVRTMIEWIVSTYGHLDAVTCPKKTLQI